MAGWWIALASIAGLNTWLGPTWEPSARDVDAAERASVTYVLAL